MCKNLLVEQIKNLPPILKDTIIGESSKKIKEQIEQKILKEFKISALIMVDDMTDILINCSNTGCSYERPEYTKNLPDELYYTIIAISEKMIDKYYCKERIESTRYHSNSDMEDMEDIEESD